jgi:FAD:protein FMN transferase
MLRAHGAAYPTFEAERIPVKTAVQVMTIVAACAVAGCQTPHETSRAWPVMGTIARATASADDPASAERATEIVRDVFGGVDASMSNWSPASELSRVNRDAGRGSAPIEDADLAACIEASLDAARATGGAFDPTVGPLMRLWGFRPRGPRVPSDAEIAATMTLVGAEKVHFDPETRAIRFDRDGMELDLGGIAKGCALDIARKAVGSRGAFGLLDLGGNLAWYGDPRGWLDRLRGSPAVIAEIRDPRGSERIPASIALRAGTAVATSSDVENHIEIDGESFGHLMDARTGRPAVTDVVQATAIHRSATVTDILSTALFVAGSDRAGEILAAYPGSEAVLFVHDGRGLAVLASRSLRGRLALSGDAGVTPDSPRFVLPAATMDLSSDP